MWKKIFICKDITNTPNLRRGYICSKIPKDATPQISQFWLQNIIRKKLVRMKILWNLNSKKASPLDRLLPLLNFFFYVIEGEEETAYWEKIKQDREAKLSGKVKTKNNSKKMRGQDRLVKKIQSMNQNENSHKFFDD